LRAPARPAEVSSVEAFGAEATAPEVSNRRCKPLGLLGIVGADFAAQALSAGA
jgi:hypothetical protein